MKIWNRREVLGAAAMTALAPALIVSAGRSAWASSAEPNITFHFYGAENCPPCMAFKRNELPGVNALAEEHGFRVAVNVIARTRDVATLGSFGDTDAVLRRAAQDLSFVYPPIFFVTTGSEVASVHANDWRAALDSAIRHAQRV